MTTIYFCYIEIQMIFQLKIKRIMKLKNTLFGVGVMLTASILGSCSNEESLPNYSDGKIYLISNGFGFTRTASTSLQASQIANGVQVGVYAKNGEDAIQNGENNLMTADGNGGFTITTNLYWPEEGDVSIFAYAPYTSEISDNTEIPVSIQKDQSTDEAYLASDFLHGVPATNPVSQSESAVGLNFSHVLSKIVLKVSVGDKSSIDLTGAVVNLVNVPTEATLNVLTAKVTTTTDRKNVKMITFDDEATSFECAAIIVPETVTAGTLITITTKEGVTYNCNISADKTFESGKVYIYNATLGESTQHVFLNLENSITDWEGDSEDTVQGEEVKTLAVGDYLLADGTFIKKNDAINYDNIIGTVFSTSVSEADAAAGYNGYVILHTTEASSVKWASESTLVEGVTNALKSQGIVNYAAMLDGLSDTKTIQAIEGFATNYPLFNITYDAGLNADNFSKSFIPSIGQWLTMLNVFGQANIDLTMVNTKYASMPNLTTETYTNIEAATGTYVTKNGVSKTNLIANFRNALNNVSFLSSGSVYASSTQHDNSAEGDGNSNCVISLGVSSGSYSGMGNDDVVDAWELSFGGKTTNRAIRYAVAFKNGQLSE